METTVPPRWPRCACVWEERFNNPRSSHLAISQILHRKREASSPSRYVSQQVLLAGQLAGYIDLPGAALQRHHNSLALELTSVLSQPNQPPEAHLT